MNNFDEEIFVKCFGCGEITQDGRSFYAAIDHETEEHVSLCEHCRKYGNGDYIVCNGCGGSAYPCWIKYNEVFETTNRNYDTDALVCKDLLYMYSQCEKCGKYYPDDCFYCPDCDSEDI